jgi:hypothetical protein
MLLKEDQIYDEDTLRQIDEMAAAEQRHLAALK